MARGPNRILLRKGMHTYKPCLTQKRCRNLKPTYQRGVGAMHMQNCALTWKVWTHTRPSSTRKGASHKWKMMQWMHATIMDTMDMARRPNQVLPRKGMYTYKPCLAQKRCRYPQTNIPTWNRRVHMQNCVLTWKSMSTYQTKLNKERRKPWMEDDAEDDAVDACNYNAMEMDIYRKCMTYALYYNDDAWHMQVFWNAWHMHYIRWCMTYACFVCFVFFEMHDICNI